MAAKHVTDFKNKYLQAAINAAAGTPIFAETIIAAAALESDWGRSRLTVQANNFFGIKAGTSWKGDTVTFSTKEQRKTGEWYTVNAKFRKYPTAEACFKNYVAVIMQPRYVNAGVTKATTPQQQMEAIKKGGYATDVKYPEKLMSVLKTMGLLIKNNPGTSIVTTVALFFFIYAVIKS